MFKWFVAALILGCAGATCSCAGEPVVTEKAVVPSPDGSYSLDNKDSKDEVKILGASEIAAMDDQKLVDAYVDVLVEIEASRVFHATSGFAPRELKKYKALLKYRIQLMLEINRRKLEVPSALN